MDMSYVITPFFTWIIAGVMKFIINCIRGKRLAFGMIGYGGLPSNHSAIVSSMAALTAVKEGIGHPSFGVAITLAFIVILDANSLRRQIGMHATVLNKLANDPSGNQCLRERIGHTRVEIAAGIAVGIVVAFVVSGVHVQY